VDLEPKNLNIPLQKRSWFAWQIAAGSMLVGWLWHRPTELPQILVSCLLGGAGTWFFLASPVVLMFGSHRSPLIRGIAVLLAVASFVLFMSEVVPYAHKLVT
jgi:hypothetical protein